MDGDKHICSRSEEIGEMKTMIELIKKKVMGNGREGLDTQVPKLTATVAELNKLLPELQRGVNAVAQFKTEAEIEEKIRVELEEEYKEKQHNRIRRNRFIITTLVAISSILFTLIITKGCS